MKTVKIYLCDLTHTGNKIANESIPLGIGYVAAYAKKIFGDRLEIKLFKYPAKLLEAINRETPDILGCSNYVWNDSINEFFCKKVKNISQDVITIKGGPNFPLGLEEQKEYLQENLYTDFYIPYEGEKTFTIFLDAFFARGLAHIKDEKIAGTFFLDHSQHLCCGDSVSRIENLDDVPSPYLTGMLDEFFDGDLVPLLERTRGCPFACNYCNAGYDYYTAIKKFSLERVRTELHYIGTRMQPLNFTFLVVTDMNFGMYREDFEVAQELIICQKQYKWPLSVHVETGKNKIELISKVIDLLKDSTLVKISLQSYNDDVLTEIRRTNINPNVYYSLCEQLKERGQTSGAELILPLPLETFNSYLDGMRFLINAKVDRITNYTLQINYGTEYKNKDYLEKFCYKTFFRPYANCFGRYDNQLILEYEEVGVSTNTLSMDDYLQVRKLSLLIEVLHNNGLFHEVYQFIHDIDLKPFDFLYFCFQNFQPGYEEINAAFDDFLNETRDELFESKESMLNFFSQPQNLQKLIEGDLGRNVIFANYAIIIKLHLKGFIRFVFDCLTKFSDQSGTKERASYQWTLPDLESYVSLKLKGVFSKELDGLEEGLFQYDIKKWAEQKEKPLSLFRWEQKQKIYFYFDEQQRHERNDNFNRYGNDVAGLAKILAKIQVLKKFFRKTGYTNPIKP